MSCDHLLQQGVSEGGLAQTRLELRPRHGHRDPREGPGAGGGQRHQDGGAHLQRQTSNQSAPGWSGYSSKFGLYEINEESNRKLAKRIKVIIFQVDAN